MADRLPHIPHYFHASLPAHYLLYNSSHISTAQLLARGKCSVCKHKLSDTAFMKVIYCRQPFCKSYRHWDCHVNYLHTHNHETGLCRVTLEGLTERQVSRYAIDPRRLVRREMGREITEANEGGGSDEEE